MTRTDTRRGGFTLLELMVVILLIITLAALSAGAFYKIQAGQRAGATESTLRKIQIHMDNRWRVVLEDASDPKKPIPDNVLALAGGDKERALALWTYAKLQNEFPQTFAEANAPITVDYPAGGPVEYTLLQPRTVFSKVTVGAAEPDTRYESAALIYAALTATGAGGTSGDLDGLNQQVGTTPGGRPTFVDNWGTPIAFARWADPDEVQSEPYSRPNQIRSRVYSTTPFPVRNPLDPSAKLVNRLDNEWGASTAAPYLQIRQALLNQFYPGNGGWTEFPNRNFIQTLISAGPDKIFGAFPYGTNSTDDGSDNVLSYRLRREGAQGN